MAQLILQVLTECTTNGSDGQISHCQECLDGVDGCELCDKTICTDKQNKSDVIIEIVAVSVVIVAIIGGVGAALISKCRNKVNNIKQKINDSESENLIVPEQDTQLAESNKNMYLLNPQGHVIVKGNNNKVLVVQATPQYVQQGLSGMTGFMLQKSDMV